MKKMLFAMFALMAFSVAVNAAERTLTLEEYRDKMKGAWIGQMVGVAWGQPTEFKWKDAIIPDDKVPEWTSDFPLRWAYGNDDLYVDMTFLRTLDEYGLDVSIRQAGIDFANTEYRLWCANSAGRTNLRLGIAPPDCSHPKHNKCPNDIDYQIEADFAGIISPGCPQEVIRLGNVFGRLMNYGDGVWSGQFVGAMYAEAFFSSDVNVLLDAGLAAIPAESDYAQMVRNVRKWHGENPSDWTKCWELIRANYSKVAGADIRDSNGAIDARLNGACIVLGLLYGDGDLDKSMELSMRCGWDSDCNPANVGGILMTACGFKALPAKYVEKLDYERKFSFTDYNLPGCFATCEKLARQVVTRNGGRVEKNADGVERFVIPVKKPVPDQFIPSWNAPAPEGSRYSEDEMAKQKFALRFPNPEDVSDPDPTVRVQKALDALFPGWKTSKNGDYMNPGFLTIPSTTAGLLGLVRTHPPKRGEAVTLSRTMKLPDGGAMLHFEVANEVKGDFKLVVRVNGTALLSTTMNSPDGKQTRYHLREFDVSLAPWAGKEATIELVNEPTGWLCEAAVWHGIRIVAAQSASADVAAAIATGCATDGRFPANATLKTNGGPLVQAHRGSRCEYDDNAAGGFRMCLERGIRGFETDIRFTKDKKLVIMHDKDVNRTTDGKGIVEEMTLDDLKKCRLQACSEPVPTLEEVLSTMAGRDDVFVELEMKAYASEFYTPEVLDEYCRALNATARRLMKPGTYAFTCFSTNTLATMRRADPSAPIGYIVGAGLTERHIATAKSLGCCGIAPLLANTTKEMVARAHEEGLAICLWMCQDAAAWREAKEKGADRVTSDYPVLLKRAIEGRAKKVVAMDLDATLCQHRSPIPEGNLAALKELDGRYKCVMVGAGNAPRIYRQMGNYPIDIVSNYGMQVAEAADGNFRIVKAVTNEVDRAFFREKTDALRAKYGYTKYEGEPLEFHASGMVTFGLLGTAPSAEHKVAFDPDRRKRRAMYPEVCEIFKDFSVYIGGSTSFDFAGKRYNKYDATLAWANDHGYKLDDVVFIGDDFADGGGDSHVRIRGMDHIVITDYKNFANAVKVLLK